MASARRGRSSLLGAFALWQLKVLVALLLLALIIASAMRPGVEWLHDRRIPRRDRRGDPLPRFPDRDRPAPLADRPARARPDREGDRHDPDLCAATSPRRRSTRTGSSTRSSLGLQHRLERLPSGAGLIHPAVTYGRTALEVARRDLLHLRDRRLLDLREGAGAGGLREPARSRASRKRLIDTWDLIDAKLGAFVRGQLRDDHVRQRRCSRSRSG